MYREFHWVFGPLAFAIAFAFIAPVFAADKGQDIALASTSAKTSLHVSLDMGDAGAAEIIDPESRIVTGAPTRLSPLAGNDTIAWDNAHSIHAWQRPHRK